MNQHEISKKITAAGHIHTKWSLALIGNNQWEMAPATSIRAKAVRKMPGYIGDLGKSEVEREVGL